MSYRWLVLAFALGAAWLQTRPALPALAWAAVLPLLGLVWIVWRRRSTSVRRGLLAQVEHFLQIGALLILFALLGFFYAGWRAELRLAESLPSAWEGREMTLSGRVLGLPETTPHGLRFVFDVAGVHTPGASVPGRVQLGWFVRTGTVVSDLAGGACVQLGVRLHRPQGSVNPGGFDYDAWLLERGIRATGSLVGAPLPVADCPGAARAWLDQVRTAIRERLRVSLGEKPYAGVIVALAVGDQAAIPGPQWTLFRQTGTSHLFSVSGLHITLFSALVFALVRWIWRCIPALNMRIPARTAGVILGLCAAAAYAALSGFAIPAQRTLLMLASAAAVTLLDRTPTASRLLAAALLVVVVNDPWAAHAPGFWLSFGAVAALLFADQGRLRALPMAWQWVRAQWAVTLALTPLLLMLFQEVSLVSPLANLFAIPLISLFAVPLSLLAALIPWGLPATWAHAVVAAVMWLLEGLVGLPQPLFHSAAPSLLALLLALAGVGLLLLPRGVPGRWLGWMLFLPLFFPRLPAPEKGEVWLNVLDVGQGKSVLVRTSEHALLFDTGPLFASGEDAGARVIAPALWHQGIKQLDVLMVSHDDLDHTGGAASLLRSHRPTWFLSAIAGVSPESLGPIGQRLRAMRPDAMACVAGQTWVWDAVRFDVLHPPEHQYRHRGQTDNSRSCVLLVRTAKFSALLTGDIERLAEMNLIERNVLRPVDVLVAAHHGSSTSSSPAFLAVAKPDWVVIPVGYRNRYGHPHPEVLTRFRAIGAQVARTDRDGAVTVRLQREHIELLKAREIEPRYWRR